MESQTIDNESDFSDTTYEASTDDEELSDLVSMDLEEEEDVTTLTRTTGDLFLNKLCYENTQLYFANNVDEFDDDDNLAEDNTNVQYIEEDNEGTEHVVKGKVYPIHDPNMNWKDMRPVLGHRYENPAQLKFALCCYGVVNGYLLSYKKNETKRLHVVCGNKDVGYACPFRLWASWMQGEKSFQIKSLNDNHNCSRNYSLGSLVTATWIAKMYIRELIARPFVKTREMQADMLRDYMVKVSPGQCSRAKSMARFEIEGGLKEHYAKIWDYAHEILRTNPGSSVKVGVNGMPDGSNVFSRIYICFKALKEGWVTCRKVIGLDGTFLKGLCKGELLTATGRDANNQIYPIAWAVVDVENKDNWKWFIECLKDDIGISDGRGLTIISDQHKGLVEALKDLLHNVEHKQCARHIYANFKKKYNGVEYRNLFWAASKTTLEHEFVSIMDKIKSVSIEAYDHLIERDPNTWSREFFETDRACESVENGISESFNSVIMNARRKPIITMLEEIRMFLMERNYNMSKKSHKWDGKVCPAIRKKIRDWSKNSRNWIVIPSGGNVFEVRNVYEAYTVDLDNRECSCRLWQKSGLPCLHSVSAIYSINNDPEDYVSDWFRVEKLRETYKHYMKPLNGSKMWKSTPYIQPLPPKERRMPGRPSIKRKRHETEKQGNYKKVSTSGRYMTCSNCLEKGHNKKTCTNEKKIAPPKEPKKKGRPRSRMTVEDNSERGGRGGRGRRGGK